MRRGPSSRKWPAAAGAAAVLAACVAAADAAARGPESGQESGWYLGAAAIGAIASAEDAAASGFAGPATIDGQDEIVVGLGATAGYAWRELPLRTELELAHRYRFDFDGQDLAPGGTRDYAANVATTSLLLNAVLEWRNATAFTPFAGVSLGVAHHHVDTTRRPAGAGGGKRDRNAAEFAWGGLIGVDWDFAERWTAEIAYRYLDLGRIDTGTLFTGERLKADDLVSHDLLLAVQYRF